MPVRFVRLAWQAIKVATQQLPRIQEFIRYFEDTWLVGNYPSIIYVYRSDSFRTNNHLERLPGWEGTMHPNIYEFVQVIQKEQIVTEVFVLQLEAGARPPQRTLKAINTDRKIQELKNALILIKLH